MPDVNVNISSSAPQKIIPCSLNSAIKPKTGNLISLTGKHGAVYIKHNALDQNCVLVSYLRDAARVGLPIMPSTI